MRDDDRRGRGGEGRRRLSFDRVNEDDERDDEDDGDERPRRARGRGPVSSRGRGASGRTAPSEEGLWSRLFGSKRSKSRRPIRQDRYDWGAADDEDEDDRGHARSRRRDRDEGDDDREVRRPSRRAGSRRSERLTLMDLCTPVFGYAALLPREPGGIHPSYQQFRQEVRNALQRIKSEAPEHGIDRQDAEDAWYGLSLFVDEQVGDSEWSGKTEWSSEPLYMLDLNDPQGGENFFTKLKSFGNRQRAVKEIYLVCLTMGFRGMYALMDPAEQAKRLGEIRQQTIRSIHPEPLGGMDVLFPEAYEPADAIAYQAPPPPTIWVVLSIAGVVLSVILYAFLYWSAGTAPLPAAAKLKNVKAAPVSSEGGER